MDPLTALYFVLMVAFVGTTYCYRSLLLDEVRRRERIERELHELRERERRYYAAHMKARTP